MTRTPAKLAAVRELGATPVLVDALDPDAVARAVADAEPDVIVHELTALSGSLDVRHFDRDFAPTNRLRTDATDHLLAAGRMAEIRRFVAQSFAGWPFARIGRPVKTEADPLDPNPPDAMRATLAALRHLEEAVVGATWTDGIVLRYGGFYGPGTSMDPNGEHARLIRRRRFPVVGGGAGVWSFVHIVDAAQATADAVGRGRPGIYNIVDDEPARVCDWLPAVAASLGGKPPRRVPRLVGRLLAGEVAAVMMTDVRGASNAKAKRELGWQPSHPTWRDGFASYAGVTGGFASDAGVTDGYASDGGVTDGPESDAA
jgi:nucleoside-diphosphate-sugar epimerase